MSQQNSPAVTIVCGNDSVVYKTVDDLMDSMQQIFATEFHDLSINPVTNYLKTLSYQDIRSMTGSGRVVVSLYKGRTPMVAVLPPEIASA